MGFKDSNLESNPTFDCMYTFSPFQQAAQADNEKDHASGIPKQSAVEHGERSSKQTLQPAL